MVNIKPVGWDVDTCDCSLAYEYDDDSTEPSPQLTLIRIDNVCPAHQGLNTTTLFDTVRDESPRLGYSLREILDNGPTGIFEIDPESGQRVFKKGITVFFSWSGVAPNRLLTLTVTGTTLTTQQRTNLQTRLDNKFGAGKVALVQG
jgi:hypothetical protein